MIIWFIIPVHNLIFVDIRGALYGIPLIAALIYHSIFKIILGGLLPPLIMIISAILIRYNLVLKQEQRQPNINTTETVKQTFVLVNRRDHQALIMLFVQVFFYILSSTPWLIYLMFNSVTRDVTNKSIDHLAIESFMGYLTELIVYMYPTLSFYIYTLTSRTFRRQLIKTIHSIITYANRYGNHLRRVQPIIENK